MPRVNGVMQLPPGSYGAPNTSVKSAPYNTVLDDFVNDANNARPITAGGTGASSASEARQKLGVEVGVNVQAYDALLQAIAGLTTSANQMIYMTGADTVAVTSVTDYGRSLIAAANKDAARALLDAGAGASNNFNGRVTARATAAGPGYSTAAVEVKPVTGTDSDWATIGFHRPGVSGYSITHVGNGLSFYDGASTVKHQFPVDGRIWGAAYGYLDDFFLGKAGGTLSGTVSFGPAAGSFIAANGDIRVKRATGEGYIYYGDTQYLGWNGATLMSSTTFRASGNLIASGIVYSADGLAYLNTDGNTGGSIWQQWGANDAFSATNLRIESRGAAYKDTAVSLIMPTVAGQNAGALGTYAFARYQGAAGTIVAGTLVSGNEIAYADANSGNAGVIGVGTWRCMGLAQTDTDRNTLYLRVS